MTKPTCLTLKVVALLLAGTYFSGCTGGAASSSFGSTASSSTTVSEIPDGASNGLDDPNFFFIGVDNTNNSIAHVHQTKTAVPSTDTFSTKCSIDPKTVTSKQDITCIMDIPEGELYFHGLKMIYNVPPDMCRYLLRKPYWYYNQPVGRGPKFVEIKRKLIDGLVDNTYTCSIDKSPFTQAACTTTFPEISIDVKTLQRTCVYNTLTASGCFGNYHLIVTETNVNSQSGATGTTVTESDENWGGKLSTVLGGAARLTAWPVNKSGQPMDIITDAAKGIPMFNYSLAAPIETIEQAYNMEIANYYTTTPAIHAHSGFVLGTTSNAPFFIDPIDDLDGTPITASASTDPSNPLIRGQESYEFQCLDQAFEVKHRVRVYVREWDTYQDYADFISSKGQTEVPDRNGLEGATCDGLTGACNDIYDIDDFLVFVIPDRLGAPLPGGLYDTTDPKKRSQYFPKLKTR